MALPRTSFLRLLLFLIAATLAPRPAQAQYTCDDPPPDFQCLCPQYQDTLQCKVCGFTGSSPFGCTAYNSTFDDLPKNKPVSNYQYTNWSSSTLVASRGPANPIVPSSPKRYLRSTTGLAQFSFTSGMSPYGDHVGDLYSFAYACADPCGEDSSQRPVACNVTVTAGSLSADDSNAYVFYYNATYPYDPAGERWASMAQGLWDSDPFLQGLNDSRAYYLGVSWNFTFEATMANGDPAFLYLDDVVTNTWHS